MATPVYDYEKDVPAGFYDEIYHRKAGVRHRWHALKFRAVARHLGAARTVLDVGCGPGTFVGNYLAGVEALGIDASVAQVDYANRRYGNGAHRFSTQPVTSLVEAGRRFDAVTMIELIEHLPVDEVVWLFEQARRLLSPGGVLVVTTPNYASLWPVIEWGVNLVSRVSYEQQHVNKYRRARLSAQLAGAGYRSVTVTTAVGLAPFAAVLGAAPADWLQAVEARLHHLGCGNLLLATGRP